MSLFHRPAPLNIVRLPSGSFTVDPEGHLLASTLPQNFPVGWIREIAGLVIATFRAAQAAELPLSELAIDYSALKLTARSLRGGAIVFLHPQGLSRK